MIRQWEIWKCRVPGFAPDHWFVILSGQERLEDVRSRKVNGLACFTLIGSPKITDVVLNSAEGFEHRTVCQCDFIYILPKSELYEKIGVVGTERQRVIKDKLKEVFRIH
jgi:hypothetical protein